MKQILGIRMYRGTSHVLFLNCQNTEKKYLGIIANIGY